MASRHSDAPSFVDLGVPAGLAAVLATTGRTDPFPIQAATLPDSLAGRDVLGRGRTGSGKTLAFALPVVVRLAASRKPRRPGRPRALVLAPTRELATQIKATIDPLAAKAGLTTMTVFGGVGERPQISALRRGVDIVVACPGRLHALIRDGHADLGAVEITVLDEADHMADLGFLPTVRALMADTPAAGQRLLFSATLDSAVEVLVQRFLNDPITHSIDPPVATVPTLSHRVLQIDQADRVRVVAALTGSAKRTLVFTRTKHGARKLAKQLNAAGVSAVELHGNLGQNARTRNVAAFGDGTATALVATDIAARGLHVDDVGLVVHADPPVEHKAYLHRSGRTGRAGASGTVITLMTVEQHREVGDLTRQAGIDPGFARIAAGAAVPAPGTLPSAADAPMPRTSGGAPQPARATDQPARSGRSARPGRSGDAAPGRSGQQRSGHQRSGQRSGEQRSGEQRPGESRSGQSRSGQQRSGQARSAQQRSGQARSGEQRSGQSHQGGQAGNAGAATHSASAFSGRSRPRRSGRNTTSAAAR